MELTNEYFINLANQLAFLCAFLGGFSATFLATILVSGSKNHLTNWIISLTAISACSFIVATICFVMAITILHPDAPEVVRNNQSINSARIFSTLGFIVGILTLLSSIGLSGWQRSKVLGFVTSLTALIATVLVMFAITGFK